jgi:transcriptional regulator with XRE-family HTH domain
MEQMNLGKRISELRKAKGLTQEELAEQCKISARTLQRIEAGAVTPRAYTVRVIYAALNQDSSLPRLHFEYVKDLFNIKKNTMKKVSFLLVAVLATGFGLFALCSEGKAQKSNHSGYVRDQSKKGIIFLYPKGLWPYEQRVNGDTTSYMYGNYLVQEHNMDIYLNREYVGRVDVGGTVKLDTGAVYEEAKITITKGSYAMKSMNTKNIIYVFPLNEPVSHGMNNDEYEIWKIDKNIIREEGNKIYLNGVYQGEAFANDTVIFKPTGTFFRQKGTLTIKNVNRNE